MAAILRAEMAETAVPVVLEVTARPVESVVSETHIALVKLGQVEMAETAARAAVDPAAWVVRAVRATACTRRHRPARC
jgi:hypothetical protein